MLGHLKDHSGIGSEVVLEEIFHKMLFYGGEEHRAHVRWSQAWIPALSLSVSEGQDELFNLPGLSSLISRLSLKMKPALTGDKEDCQRRRAWFAMTGIAWRVEAAVVLFRCSLCSGSL